MFMKPPGAKPAITPEEITENMKEALQSYLVDNMGMSEEEAEEKVRSVPFDMEFNDNILISIGIWSERIVVATSIPCEMLKDDPDRSKMA